MIKERDGSEMSENRKISISFPFLFKCLKQMHVYMIMKIVNYRQWSWMKYMYTILNGIIEKIFIFSMLKKVV